MLKCIKVILMTVILLSFVTTASAVSYVSAHIKRVRTTGGAVDIMLSYIDGAPECAWGEDVGSPTNVWFIPEPDDGSMDNQTMAIALTAISIGKSVRMGIEVCPDDAGEGYATYSSIGLNDE